MRNLLLRFAALFGLLLAAAAVYFGSTWGGGLPALRGGLTVQGIGGEVRIRRDQYGIAQIASPHDSDVFFDIGYARQFVGSNAWVVSGKLTDDGRAYLANAPISASRFMHPFDHVQQSQRGGVRRGILPAAIEPCADRRMLAPG